MERPRLPERTGVVLQVGHIERFSPAFRALAERVRAPRLMSFVRHAVWQGRSADVDVVRDLMIHDIDLALTLAGAPVVSVAFTVAVVVCAVVGVPVIRPVDELIDRPAGSPEAL